MKVFISYTLRDKNIDKEFLLHLENALSLFSDVFIDLIHNDSNNRQQRIMNEVSTSDIILVVETRKTYESEWVKIEIDKAKELKKKIISIKLHKLKKCLTESKRLQNIFLIKKPSDNTKATTAIAAEKV